MQSESPQLDELYEHLKHEDPEWLHKTLYEKWIETSHQQQADRQPPTVSQQPIWPFDVTLPTLPQDLQVSDYVHFVRSFNWKDTALGPMSNWGPDLRRLVNLCLCDRRAAAIWILPDYIGIYNEEYSYVAGEKHPRVLGRSFAEVWPESEVREPFMEFFNAGRNHGKATNGDDARFLVSRNGFREELWCSWSIIPIAGLNGGVMGMYNSLSITTRQALSSRRLSALISLGQNTALAWSVSEFWSRLLESCDENWYDVPFAILYSSAAISVTSATQTPNKVSTSNQWKLEGCVGVSPEHLFPAELDSGAVDDLFYTGFSDALTEPHPFQLSVEDDTFPRVIRGVVKSRIYGDICDHAIALPIRATNREETLGFLILGLNPNITYSTEYADFLELFTRQCTTSLASAFLVQDEKQRSHVAAQAATQDKLRMSMQLAESQQKATDVEARFKMMADLAPVAMFYIDKSGRILYANENWYDLTQHSPNNTAPKSWMNNVHPLDEELVEKAWRKLVDDGVSVNFEMRLKKPFLAEGEEHFDGERVEGLTWTIASAYAEKKADGSVKAILGCLTDISRQKWMEGQRSRRMQEALELKRQQEAWMDMTSHECRNPLSAIMLCIEGIITTLQDQASQKTDPVKVKLSTIESSLEGAETIMACAQHQKRIIDDVLTLSKLDSGLLTICAVEMQPLETIFQALKMFDSEIRKNDIELTLHTDASYKNLSVDWVQLDPSRLLQVLINLLTNAVKFTQAETVRQIQVTLSATDQRPTSSLHNVKYIQEDLIDNHDSNTVFIGIEVIDTGRGMDSGETKNLFLKFHQASPKTHVEYGGSGLGLFISKQLTRMLGGEIGVDSSGRGAKFAFYVQAPRCAPPEIAIIRKESAVSAQERSNSETQKVVTEIAAKSIENPPFKQHILIVEDNVVNQKVMRNQLERLQHSVNVANHGLEALDHIQGTRFCREDGVRLDIMLLDVEMPVCNGLECARRIREMETNGSINGHIPIIGVTANARAEQQAEALKWMDCVVTKPFRLAELSAALEEMSRRFQVGVAT